MSWKIAKAVMATLLVGAAALQWNDPDPIPWMLIYGAAAFASLKIGAPIRAAVATVALAWGVLLVTRIRGPIDWSQLFSMAPMKGDAIEVIRESTGLALVAIWMGVLLFGRRPDQPPI